MRIIKFEQASYWRRWARCKSVEKVNSLKLLRSRLTSPWNTTCHAHHILNHLAAYSVTELDMSNLLKQINRYCILFHLADDFIDSSDFIFHGEQARHSCKTPGECLPCLSHSSACRIGLLYGQSEAENNILMQYTACPMLHLGTRTPWRLIFVTYWCYTEQKQSLCCTKPAVIIGRNEWIGGADNSTVTTSRYSNS